MKITTPLGTLEAVEHKDSNYPGITLYWQEQQVGMLEYNSIDDSIHMHVWKDGQENPTVSLVIERDA